MFNIGIDIGGVLVGKGNTIHEMFEVPDSLTSLEYLSKNNNLYIISYCGERRAQENYNNLYGIDLFTAQYYVSKKIYKSSIIDYLDCDVMIDDNENILNDIKKNHPNVATILFQTYNKQKKRKHKHHYLVDSWTQVVEIINNITSNSKDDNKELHKDPFGSGFFIDEPPSLE